MLLKKLLLISLIGFVVTNIKSQDIYQKIYDTIEQDDIKTLQSILEDNNVDINFVDESEDSILTHALRKLSQKIPNIDSQKPGDDWSQFDNAVKKTGKIVPNDIIRLLIEKGAIVIQSDLHFVFYNFGCGILYRYLKEKNTNQKKHKRHKKNS